MHDPLNLYSILGLTPDCTDLDVRYAYIKRARETHSDTGGDTVNVDEFMAVRDAYAVLSDTEARSHYDSTGTVLYHYVQVSKAEVYHTVSAVFDSVLNRVLASKTLTVKAFNFMGKMKEEVDKAKNNLEEQRAETYRQMSVIEVLLKQIKRNDDEKNAFAESLFQKKQEFLEKAKKLTHDIEVSDRVLTELEVYHSEVEMIHSMQTYSTGVPSNSSSTSNGIIFVRYV